MRTGTVDLLTCDESSVLEDSEHVFFVVLHWGKRITDPPVYCKPALFPAADLVSANGAVSCQPGHRLRKSIGVRQSAEKRESHQRIHPNELAPKNEWRFQRYFVFRCRPIPGVSAPGFE